MTRTRHLQTEYYWDIDIDGVMIACVVSEVDGHLFCGKSSIHNPPINLSSPERRKMRDRAEAEAVALSKLKKQNKL